MTKHLARWSAAAALLLAAQACAPAMTGVSPSGTPLHERTVITAEEVTALRLRDLHSVVRALHPDWLQAEGEIGVFVHGARRGGPETLAELVPSDSMQVRFLDAAALARQGARLDASGLSAAILVEAPSRVSVRAPGGPFLPPGMHFTVAAYGVQSGAETTDPLVGQSEYTLQSESRSEELGWSVAARLSYRGIYLQPVYASRAEDYKAVYLRAAQVRVVSRELAPSLGVFAGYEYGPIRAGVGVMAERETWRWGGGNCQCQSIGEDAKTEMVPVAELAATARLWRMLGAELRVTGRQRPATDVHAESFFPATYVRQDESTVLDVSLGLSARFH